MQLLHLDSSALAASVSRRLSAEIVARQRALHADLRVTYRDLAADPALHRTGAAHRLAVVPRLTDVKVVRAEGLAFGPDAKEAAVSSALEDIAAITA